MLRRVPRSDIVCGLVRSRDYPESKQCANADQRTTREAVLYSARHWQRPPVIVSSVHVGEDVTCRDETAKALMRCE